ncbi:hypothetical protein B0H14DRAFT_3741714 [Mycena olivaceomarginata]|nr:hypothetical protein B0H14DRAFT_3741714 [Mycena olivaceomarginata]
MGLKGSLRGLKKLFVFFLDFHSRAVKQENIENVTARPRLSTAISTLNLAFLVLSDHLDLSHRRSPQISFAKRRAQIRLDYEVFKTGPNFRPHVLDSSTNTEIKVLPHWKAAMVMTCSHRLDFLGKSLVLYCRLRAGKYILASAISCWNRIWLAVEQLSQCRAIFSDRRSNPTTTLFRMDQEFPVDFSAASNVTFVGQAWYSFKIEQMFRAHATHKRWAGLVSSVSSLRPDPQYSQRQVVHLRITKIVTPISRSTQLHRDPTLVLKPEDGQLLTRAPYGHAPGVRYRSE